MKHYFNHLNERERWMLVAAALALFIYAYYLLLYAPLSRQVSQKSAQLIEKTQTLAWMQKIRPQAHSSTKKQSLENSQLLTVLADQLKENKTLKFPYQLQQTGSGEVQLTFESVPFKLFVLWLAGINKKYTFAIKQFDAVKTEEPGVIKLTVILSGSV